MSTLPTMVPTEPSQPPAPTAAPAQPRPKKAPSGFQWPLMVVGLLGLNICICAVTITAATKTKPEVEPDYYRRALQWDEHRAEQTALNTPVVTPTTAATN